MSLQIPFTINRFWMKSGMLLDPPGVLQQVIVISVIQGNDHLRDLGMIKGFEFLWFYLSTHQPNALWLFSMAFCI